MDYVRLRYTVTSDKLLFAGSETGMIQFPNEKIIFKGRLGPGQAIAIDLEAMGKFMIAKV